MTDFLKKWQETDKAFDPKKPSAVLKLADTVDILLAKNLPQLIDDMIVAPQEKLNAETAARLSKIEAALIQVLEKLVPIEEALKKQGMKVAKPVTATATNVK